MEDYIKQDRADGSRGWTKVERPRKFTDDQAIAAYKKTGSVWKAADILGVCGQSVHERLCKLGVIKPINKFSDSDKRRLERDYRRYRDATSNLVALTNAADMHHLSEKDVRVIVSHMEECIANPSVKPVVSEPIPIEVEPEIIPEPVEYEESF